MILQNIIRSIFFKKSLGSVRTKKFECRVQVITQRHKRTKNPQSLYNTTNKKFKSGHLIADTN